MEPGHDDSTVLVPRSEHVALVRESRQGAIVMLAGGALMLWASVLLAVGEPSRVLWVWVFAIIGIAGIAWGAFALRRFARRYGSPGTRPPDGPISPVPYVDRQDPSGRQPGGGAFPPDAGGGPGI